MQRNEMLRNRGQSILVTSHMLEKVMVGRTEDEISVFIPYLEHMAKLNCYSKEYCKTYPL